MEINVGPEFYSIVINNTLYVVYKKEDPQDPRKSIDVCIALEYSSHEEAMHEFMKTAKGGILTLSEPLNTYALKVEIKGNYWQVGERLKEMVKTGNFKDKVVIK